MSNVRVGHLMNDALLGAAEHQADQIKKGMTDDIRLASLSSLLEMVETGLKIAKLRLEGKPEPYPGAALKVAETTLRAIDLARKTGVLK